MATVNSARGSVRRWGLNALLSRGAFQRLCVATAALSGGHLNGARSHGRNPGGGPGTLDQIAVRFDEQGGLVSDAGAALTGSLAERLGVEQGLVNDSVWGRSIRRRLGDAALPGRKVMRA